MKLFIYRLALFVIILGQLKPVLGAERAQRVSIFELLSISEEYDTKKVKVIGYLHKSSAMSFELYPYLKDVELSDKSRAIRIITLSKTGKADLNECENKYVEIHGSFSKSSSSALSDVLHSLEKILAYDAENTYMKYSPCYNPDRR